MLNNQELAGHLDCLLQRMSIAIDRQKDHFAEKVGISRQQFDVLCIIYEKGQITMGELCKEISSACSTATDLADKLERVEYVERVREKRDRRVVRLKILPKGEKLVKEVINIRTEKIKDILDTFQPEDVKSLLSLAETLVSKIEKID